MSSAYNIERKDAAEMLNVSERTLDRYIRKGKVKAKKVGRNVLLSEKEIQRLAAEMGHKTTISNVDIVDESPTVAPEETTKMSTGKDVTIKGDIYVKAENIVYKNLFEKAVTEIEKKNDDLKMLNYKLGQIETQMKNTVPLLDFRRTEDNVSKLKAQHKAELDAKEAVIEEANKLYHSEKVNKYIYLSILGAFAGVTIITWIMQAMYI